LIIIIFM